MLSKSIEVFVGNEVNYRVESALRSLPVVVGDERFYVNRVYLVETSAFFKVMLEADFSERNNNIIEICDENPNEFHVFLCALLPTINGLRPKGITVESFAPIMRLADKYLVYSLQYHCLDFIRSCIDYCTADECTSILGTARDYLHQPGCKSSCIKLLADVLERLRKGRATLSNVKNDKLKHAINKIINEPYRLRHCPGSKFFPGLCNECGKVFRSCGLRKCEHCEARACRKCEQRLCSASLEIVIQYQLLNPDVVQ